MCEPLVDVIKIDLIVIVTVNRLQTGDIAQEGASGQAAKYYDRVLALRRREIKRLPLGIKETGGRLCAD